MGPAFGLGETKGLYPYFTQCADSVSNSLLILGDWYPN